jgi:heptaprenyl diphosphate synthase
VENGSGTGAEQRLKDRLADMEVLFGTLFAGEGPDDGGAASAKGAEGAEGTESAADAEAEMGGYAYDMLMSGGKRLRPGLVSLAAGFGDADGAAVVDVMAAVEIIHTSSLIHDDIVDDSGERRGKPTISALRGDGYAAQCGYFLISKAVDVLEPHIKSGVADILADTVMDMCRGELRQIKIEDDFLMQSPDDYFVSIGRKTARLIEGSCKVGCRIAGAGPDCERALGEYGMALGTLFQLRDDLLDCGLHARDGKPVHQDLRRGIFTLPVLYAASRSGSGSGRERFLELLAKDGKDSADMEAIIAHVEEAGGIEYAKQSMARYASRAQEALGSLPDIEERMFLSNKVSELMM